MKSGDYPFFYTNTARLGKKLALEISDEKVDYARRIRFEHHTFYLSQNDGASWRREDSDVKLMLFEPAHFKKLVARSGLSFQRYCDLNTAKMPTKKTEASAAQPAVACTTIPPAKSRTPHFCNNPPPHTM